MLTKFPMFGNGYRFILETLRENPELNKYISIFEEIGSDSPLDRIRNIYNAYFIGKKANLFVLTHSDFHIKNFMIKENSEGELEDVKLIDFQLCIWAPASIDLIYLIYMALDCKSRLERRDEIIEFYHSIFEKTLVQFGFRGDIPNLGEIHEDLMRFKDFGQFHIYNFILIFFEKYFLEIFMLITTLPCVLAFQEDSSIICEEAYSSTEMMKSFYHKPVYVEYLKKALPVLFENGYFDCYK